MMKLLATMTLGLLAVAGCSGGTTSEETTKAPVHPKGQVSSWEVDPVCGMQVHVATAAPRERFEGQTYWFCSEGCEMQFKSAPAAYVPGPRPDVEVK
jgi:YHS domain-containing protein